MIAARGATIGCAKGTYEWTSNELIIRIPRENIPPIPPEFEAKAYGVIWAYDIVYREIPLVNVAVKKSDPPPNFDMRVSGIHVKQVFKKMGLAE